MTTKKSWYLLNSIKDDSPIKGTIKPDLSSVYGIILSWVTGCFDPHDLKFIVLIKTKVESGREVEDSSFICDFDDPGKEGKLAVAGESIGIHGFTGAEVDIP